MTYEIPQQLEYHEKIMFGLTFKQLAYAFVFGSVSLFIFFKTPLNLFARGFIVSVLAFLGAMFIFFDFATYLLHVRVWFKFRKAYKNSAKLLKFINIDEIKDNCIIANKKKIAIIKVFSINFNIKSEGEKETIILVFRKFLNSLEFPVQILMDTTTLEPDKYLESLKQRVGKCKNNLYDNLFEKYSSHLKNTIHTQGIMNRNFYLIIPESTNIGIQVKVCEDRLRNLNLGYKRLENAELKELLVKFFEGKGKGKLIEAVQPNTINNGKDYFQVNKSFNRIVSAFGYPRVVEPGFLDKIVSAEGNFDLSLHIQPYPIETMMINLNRELQKQRADLYAAEQKGIINPSLEIQYNDTRKILEELQKGQDKLFNVCLYINCKADSLEQLDLLTKKVESELNSLMIIPRVPKFRMAQGYQSCAPLARDELQIKRNITAFALSAFYPFTSPFFKVDETGVWLGLNRNNIPIIKDIFKLSNPNGIVLAQSGGGKSYFTKLLIARYLLNGVKVMVIDPQGEYKDLVKYFGGQRVNLSRTSNTMINPLDLLDHDYPEKRLSLMDLMPVMLGDLTEPQKSFIDKALTKAYETKGINNDTKTWNNEPPILQDVLQILESMEKRAITLEKTTIRSLINRISMYVDGVFSFMNKHTNLELNNSFICFDIGEMPKQVKPVTMFLVLDYVYMKMKRDISRKLLIIDEAWSLLSRAEDCSYIFEIVKTCRKFNMGLLLINQEVEGLLTSEAGKSVLANSAYTLLMKQKPAVIDQVQETFHLSKAERMHLLTANVGEGILIVDDEHSEIKVVASGEEHKIITTNADELLKQAEGTEKSEISGASSKLGGQKMETISMPAQPTPEIKEEIKPEVEEKEAIAEEIELPKVEAPAITVKPKKYVKKVRINVMEDKRYYKKSDLTPEELQYRLKNGYHESEQWDIETGQCETYLLKPRFKESDSHLFLMCRIAECLLKLTDKVWTFETNKPDIIFKDENETDVAIEVETGMMYKHAHKQLMAKVKNLNKQFGKNWFFVVTNKEYLWKYKKLGKTYTRKEVLGVVKNHFKTAENSDFTPSPKAENNSLNTHKTAVSGGGEDE